MAEEKHVKLLSLITPYAIVVSLLYLFGYWSSFGINILEYVSFPDVLKLAIYPVFLGAVLSTLGIITQIMVKLDSVKKAEHEKVFTIVSQRFAKWSTIVAAIGVGLIMGFV